MISKDILKSESARVPIMISKDILKSESARAPIMISKDILKTTLALGAALTLTHCTPAYSQTVYYTGPQGRSLGYAQTIGNTTYYTGPQGQSQGYAQTMGNTTYYSGPKGQSLGYSNGAGVATPIPPVPPVTYPQPLPTWGMK